ncbi:MAG: toprim domain-containing protein [Candidatus Omnitrophica bacterium]|nr:toprim domain-containing protein [Candidatus Omnitrophota bacterium]
MNARELAQIMADNADTVARYLLPAGKRDGREWRAGSVNGDAGQSLGVCVEGTRAGVWADFATDQKGDLLDLWMSVRGVSLVDAMKEAADFLGVEQTTPQFYRKEKVWKKPVRPKCKQVKQGPVFEYLTKERGLTMDTISLFKIADGEDSIIFPFLRDGEPVMIKRLKLKRVGGKKDIRPTSDNQEPCLFGWQAVDERARVIVLTEGEIDAMSVKQMGVDALSIPFGGGKGQTWIENEYDRINRFDEIYICMDQDEPGQIAAAEIVERLGRHRCKILRLGKHKDANEALLKGYDIFDLQADLNKAETCDPHELRRLSDFHDDIMKEFYPDNEKQKGAVLPWKKVHDQVRLRLGDISVWAGINSHGKTLALSHVAVDLVSQGYRVCIASMEMSPADMGMKMYQQIGGVDKPTKTWAGKIQQFVHDGIWIFNVYGTAKTEKILQVFEYAFFRYGVKHFIVDSLAKCGINEDDYNRQKSFIDSLMEFAGKHHVHVHVVIHVRKGDDESKIPGKMDIKGTGSLTDMVDNVFIIWRNKKKESIMFGDDEEARQANRDKPDAFLKVDKQRKTGKEPTFALWFHPQSCQFIEHCGAEITSYIHEV